MLMLLASILATGVATCVHVVLHLHPWNQNGYITKGNGSTYCGLTVQLESFRQAWLAILSSRSSTSKGTETSFKAQVRSEQVAAL
jgi:hypothetical protein